MNAITKKVGGLLPPEARKWLMDASKIADHRQRVRALEEATRRARLRYPQYFKEEKQP